MLIRLVYLSFCYYFSLDCVSVSLDFFHFFKIRRKIELFEKSKTEIDTLILRREIKYDMIGICYIFSIFSILISRSVRREIITFFTPLFDPSFNLSPFIAVLVHAD